MLELRTTDNQDFVGYGGVRGIPYVCCISLDQHYAFKGSTEVPRQCFGAPNWLEQRYNGPEIQMGYGGVRG